MRFKNLTIIGTSHIAPESLKKVERTIREEQPGIIAVELDKKRLAAFLHKGKHKPRYSDIKRVGFKGWLFSLIGAWVEKQLGKKVGVSPGSEMLKAIRLAQEHSSKVALIDQDIEVTLRRFSETLSWKERWQLLWDLLKSIITRKPEIEFELTKVPSQKVIAQLMKKVKKHYPNIYKVLVTERNEAMGKNLARMMLHFPNTTIVAVVGAGHEKEILKVVKRELSLYKKKELARV